jgi:hypothetical protein
MGIYRKYKPVQKVVTGYRQVVHAREGRMLGIRQPLDGPIFVKLEDARNWCIYAMIDHYDRRLGMSDAPSSRSKAWMRATARCGAAARCHSHL